MTRQVDVGVIIATYRRPDMLRHLLKSLDAMTLDEPYDVVIIDNDPNASARQVALEFADTNPRVRYAVEPRPGIAAARNAGLRLAASSRYVAFVDDDEWVDADWLECLLQVMRATDSVAVSGPVRFHFENEPRRWITSGGFHVSPSLPEGAPMDFAATNNLLVDMTAAKSLRVTEFDNRFGITGGSDIMFTNSLYRAGGKIVWTNSAVVHERVPAERTTLRWVLRRARREGNTLARVEMAAGGTKGSRSAVRLTLLGLARCCLGAVRMLGAMLSGGRMSFGKGMRTFWRGVGIISSVLGRHVQEYAR